MLKKAIHAIKDKSKKGYKAVTGAAMAVALMAFGGTSAFAANPDLDEITGELVTGAGDMKTNALLIVGVVITIFIVIFGIGWLMSIFKKKMSKA